MKDAMDPFAKVLWVLGALCVFLLPIGLHAAVDAPPAALTADGGQYSGPLIDGKFQGQGKIQWDNGARYTGGFTRGLYSGQGRMQFASGEVYEGNFADGMMSGAGRMTMQDGSLYVGAFRNNAFHGRGRYEMANGDVYEGAFAYNLFDGRGRLVGHGATYEGEFRKGEYSGEGELTGEDGRRYLGRFEHGEYQGKGHFESAAHEIYEGEFDKGEFKGSGTYRQSDGAHYEGRFLNWRPHGPGRFTDVMGNVYEGQFDSGEMNGAGRMLGKDGSRYEGEFKHWQFDGQGVLRLANGDEYKGKFAHGLYEGQGTLTYAAARADGRRKDSGIWHYGTLSGDKDKRTLQANAELALYKQRGLLDAALDGLAPRDPARINMYLLAVAGDGTQEVFRREVEFVRKEFDRDFGTQGRSLALINSRNTVASAPMATVTSIRESLQGIAARMDREQDILFLFLTSHGSKDHELSLAQNNMELRNLPARELGGMLKNAGIKWKVIVVSACYSGGFIDSIKDEYTLVITAARRDRTSFGCADENDFTYFGRAFFKEALPRSTSFQDAYRQAEILVRQWESAGSKKGMRAGPADASEPSHSFPQMVNPPAVQAYLQRWWKQRISNKSKAGMASHASAGTT